MKDMSIEVSILMRCGSQELKIWVKMDDVHYCQLG
jgi:hypothetical protein